MKRWYRSSLDGVTLALLPLSGLFALGVGLRRLAYRLKLKKQFHFSVPVIVVGNITVGGTGKTPFVIGLAHFLKEQGFIPGIVSRGVGGKQQRSPRRVQMNANPLEVGDEAVLLAQKSQCPVMIGIDRVAAVNKLLAETNCNIVISDDGLQHYRLGRHIEIALIDGDRGLGNRCYLPAGPLRESPKRLAEVDFVVEQNASINAKNYFSMCLQGDYLVSLKNPATRISVSDWKGQTVHAVAAIGNPERFFNFLRSQGLNIITHVFPDHYLYDFSDLDFNDLFPVIMTEKDAVKCVEFAREHWWSLPVEMQLDEQVKKVLLKKIRP